MDQAIELMAGICFVALGASYLLRLKDWIGWIANLQSKGRRGSLSIGMLALGLGSFVLAFHPVWQGIPLILTLLGVLAIIKGAMMLVFPGWLPGQLARMTPHFKTVLKVKAILTLALGLALLGRLYHTW